MTPTPKTETVSQIVVDQAKAILAVCATPEGLRGLVDLWRDGSGTMDKHNRYVGSCLSVLVDTLPTTSRPGAPALWRTNGSSTRGDGDGRAPSNGSACSPAAGPRAARRPTALRPTYIYNHWRKRGPLTVQGTREATSVCWWPLCTS